MDRVLESSMLSLWNGHDPLATNLLVRARRFSLSCYHAVMLLGAGDLGEGEEQHA